MGIPRKQRGNDCPFIWHIKNKQTGEGYPLEGKELLLTLYCGSRYRRLITDYTIDGDTISFTYFGKDQTTLGVVVLKLEENAGKEGMKTVDTRETVEIVEHSWETTAGDGSATVTVEPVELTTFADIGGETNVIEAVKVNGEELPVKDKTVDVPVPTKLSQLENDSRFVDETVTDGLTASIREVSDKAERSRQFLYSNILNERLLDSSENINVDIKPYLVSALFSNVSDGFSQMVLNWLYGKMRERFGGNDACALCRVYSDSNGYDRQYSYLRVDRNTNSRYALILNWEYNGVVQVGGFYMDSGTWKMDSLRNYYLQSETYSRNETYSRDEVQHLIAAIKTVSFVYAESLPEASADTLNKIYLVPSATQEESNVKDEYITITNTEEGITTYAWELIGSTAIDLSNYLQKSGGEIEGNLKVAGRLQFIKGGYLENQNGFNIVGISRDRCQIGDTRFPMYMSSSIDVILNKAGTSVTMLDTGNITAADLMTTESFNAIFN